MSTGNSEFLNQNNNEMSRNGRECVNNSEDYTKKTQNNKCFAKNANENNSITTTVANESNSQEVLFGIGKNLSSMNEESSKHLPQKEIFSNKSNENLLSDTEREDFKSEYVSHLKQNLDVFKENDEMNVLSEENSSNEENINYFDVESSLNNESIAYIANQSDNKSPNCYVIKRGQQDKPQPMTSNYNIVPNPNEFSLVGKNNLPQQNLDIFQVNQSSNELLAFSDNSIVISNSNAIPQSDSIVSSNYSLSQLQQYISDDDDDSVIEEVPVAIQQYREKDHQIEDSDDDSDSSTSSSTSILISDSSSDSESDEEYENCTKPDCKPIKAKGEMDLNDLPPIEDLKISVPEDKCTPMGKIYQIVDQLVIVQANKDTPAFDLDTVLFVEGGKPLGKVFDVMGPVTEPYYCIRFNSKDHIKEKNITLDQTVYAASNSQYSKFVFLAQLMQMKGSDASWENDVEPPEIYLDYSDDEQEQRAKKKFYRNKKAMSKQESDPDEPARKKHSAYVKRMNARNLRLNASRSCQNSNKNGTEKGNVLWQPNLPPMMSASTSTPRAGAPSHQTFGKPPQFDMRVPMHNPPFHSPGGPQFSGQPEYAGFPVMFPGPSTSSHPQGLMPFPRHCASRGPPAFPRHCTSPQFPPISRSCSSPGSLPFSQPFTFLGPSPLSRPCSSPGPPPFSRHCASPRSSKNSRMPVFSPPPQNGQLPNHQRPYASHGWNSSPWPPPPPPHLINGPPQASYGSFPFPAASPVRPPHGPRADVSPVWASQSNSQGNSPRPHYQPNITFSSAHPSYFSEN